MLLQVHRLAVDEDAAGGGLIQAGQAVEERGLAAAGGADDAQELPLHHVEGDVIQHQQLVEFFRKVVYFYLYLFFHRAPHSIFLSSRSVISLRSRRNSGST